MPNREILTFRDSEEISRSIAKKWYVLSETALREKGFFSVALSGGIHPSVYRRLAALPDVLPWLSTHIFFVEEYFVGKGHPHSIQKIIADNCLNWLSIPRKNIHEIVLGKGSPAHSALAYEEALKDFFTLRGDALPEFDLVILGAGGYGYHADWFNEETGKSEKKRLVLSTQSEYAPYERITMSRAVINNAANICFVAAGEQKYPSAEKIPFEEMPAVLHGIQNARLSFYLDREAEQLMRGPAQGW